MRRFTLASLMAWFAGASLALAEPGVPAPPLPAVRPGGPLPVEQAPAVMPAAQALDHESGACAGGAHGPSDFSCLYAPDRPTNTWFNAEFLTWWFKSSTLPPLVTTGIPGTPSASGILFTPDVGILLGNGGVENLDHGAMPGARLAAGMWLDSCRTWGAEISYFYVPDDTQFFTATSSPTTPILARPYFDVLTKMENALIVAAPGGATGSIVASATTHLEGGEANLIYNVRSDQDLNINLLGGLRYMNLKENLDITSGADQIPVPLFFGGPLVGAQQRVIVNDHFATDNNFYGGQLGFHSEFHPGRWYIDLEGKLALGFTHETLDVNGATNVNTGAGPIVTPGGMLAIPSNSGRLHRNEFTAVPEVGVSIGYQVTCGLRAYVGYNFLYASEVVRPVDQIDRGLNGTGIPTDPRFNNTTPPLPARPAAAFRETDFWAQGITLGLEYRY